MKKADVENNSVDKKIRLQKMLAQCGVCSRRKAEVLIKKQKVEVNGKTAELGQKIDYIRDEITVEGKPVFLENKKHYIALNKPGGYITTSHDEKNRKTVRDLTKSIKERIYPVGRLDKDSEGLIIMTNDGDFANAVIHPSKNIAKVYIVTISGFITPKIIQKLKSGIVIEGSKLAMSDIIILKKEGSKAVLKIVLHQGKNRQIRKMCEHFELEVKKLKRITIGNVELGNLEPGKWRNLTEKEIKEFLS